MDVNKLVADMWKQICCINQKLSNAGDFWTTEGNIGLTPDSFLGTIEEKPLIFKTNKSERMRILSDGKVGINIDTPSTTLDINGQIRIRGGNPGSGKVLQSDGSGVGTWVTPAAGFSAAIVPFVSADFDPDGSTVTDATLNAKTYELFFNDLNRFLINTTEWNYIVGGGFQITLPGFDANSNNYNLYLFFK